MQKLLHYVISRKLGEGKHGPVYQAVDTGLDRVVAIKAFRSRFLVGEHRERFLDEMDQLLHLNDPHLTDFYALETLDDRQYLIREYIEGQSARELAQSGSLNYGQVLALGLQAARGLQRAHDRKVLHLNITSANLFVTDQGQVRLLDFSLPAVEPGADIRTLSPDDLIYLAPEQIKGEAVSVQTDFYSLGIALYETLTGSFPFAVVDGSHLADSILHQPPDLKRRGIAVLPTEAKLLLARMLEKHPEERLASTKELLATLDAMISFQLESRRHAENVGAPPGRARRYALIGVLVALVLIFWIVITTFRS